MPWWLWCLPEQPALAYLYYNVIPFLCEKERQNERERFRFPHEHHQETSIIPTRDGGVLFMKIS